MKKTLPLIFLLLFAIVSTLGSACFFSAPNNSCTAAIVPVATFSGGNYYDVAFTEPDTVEYEVCISQSLMYEYYDKILNASNPVANFIYNFTFEENAQRAYRIPSFTTFTFLSGDYWGSLKYAFVDTTNRIVAEISLDNFTMKKINTNEVLYSETFETSYCDKIYFNWRRLEVDLKDLRKQVISFDNVPDDGFKFDYFVVNQNYDDDCGPTVSAEVYQSNYHYTFCINFIDPVFPENNKQASYNAELETDTIIVADIEGMVPVVENTGNYVFLGWFNADKTPNDPHAGNIYFYAEYQKATITLQNKNGQYITAKQAYVGDTLGKAISNLFFDAYAIPQDIDLDAVITGDCTITLDDKLLVTLKYFKLERYTIEHKNKTFNYDMLTYKTVSKLIQEGTLVDVSDFDSAHYNILGKPYYETMPGFEFLGWDYDITQPITQSQTITAQYELPKLKVNYYSSNNVLFETREYDMIKDNLLLPMPEFKNGLSYWEDFKNFLENLFTLDIGQMVDDFSARDVANKMVDHLTNMYDEQTNQIFVILAKPDLNSNVQKGILGDLSADFEGSSFVRLTGTRLSNDYVLYLNPQKMYISNINYEIGLSFGIWVDPMINSAKNIFSGVGDFFGWVSKHWDIVFYIFIAVVVIILLIVFWPVVSPIIAMVFAAVWGVIKKVFQLVWKLITGFFKLLGKLFNKIFRRDK